MRTHNILVPLLLGIAIGGCSDPTELTILVYTDLEIPAELSSLKIAVTQAGVGERYNVTEDLPPGTDLPRSLVLEHGGGSLEVTITASGRGGQTDLVTQTVRTSFRPEKNLVVPLFLDGLCAGGNLICASDETCHRGACVDSRVSPSTLAEWNGFEPEVYPGNPFPSRDGGVDAGTADSGTQDAGTDTANVDAGLPDSGAMDMVTSDVSVQDAGTPDIVTVDAGDPDACMPTGGDDIDCNGVDDDCDGRIDGLVVPFPSGGGTGMHTTCGRPNLFSDCVPGTPDKVYRFFVEGRSVVTITVDRTDDEQPEVSWLDTLVCPGTTLTCTHDDDVTRILERGTYTFAVHAEDPGCTTFDIRLEIEPF